MKKIKINSYIWALLSLFLVGSCTDPLNEEIGVINAETAIVKDLVYTLTDDDYDIADDACDCANGNFSDEDDVKENIPLILAEIFPALGKQSSAIVTYNFFRGNNEGVGTYLDAVNAERYEVSSADYAGISSAAGDAGFFNNTTTVEDNISNILNTNISGPADGDLIAVTYNRAGIEYSDINFTEIYDEGFDGITDLDVSDFDLYSITGDQVWHKYTSSYPYDAARISGFSGGNQPNEDWMITPQIDLSGFSNAELRLQQVLNFLGDGEFGTDIAVMVSTDYTNDPAIATWESLEFNLNPAGDSWDPFDSKASLSDYENEQIYIGFYYGSTVDFAPNWRVIDVNISDGDEIDIVTYNEFYEYDAGTTSWIRSGEDEAYFLSSSDYDAMGAPGTFDNFSSSVNPDNYLPRFLSDSFPFAQEGDEQIMIYDYFSSSSGVQVRGDFYTFTSGVWVEYDWEIENSFGFGHNGTAWEPDNTIKYTLGSADYTSIAAAYAVLNAAGSESMGSFGNYDLTLWSSQEIFDSITARMEEIFPTVTDQKYLVEYSVWRPGSGTELIHIVWNGSAYVLVE